jgi:hypothetical protein
MPDNTEPQAPRLAYNNKGKQMLDDMVERVKPIADASIKQGKRWSPDWPSN